LSNQHIVFNVEDMTCENGKKTIQSALNKLNGVCDVIVDVDTKHVAVEFDEERLDAYTLKGTIEDVGFKVR